MHSILNRYKICGYAVSSLHIGVLSFHIELSPSSTVMPNASFLTLQINWSNSREAHNELQLRITFIRGKVGYQTFSLGLRPEAFHSARTAYSQLCLYWEQGMKMPIREFKSPDRTGQFDDQPNNETSKQISRSHRWRTTGNHSKLERKRSDIM